MDRALGEIASIFRRLFGFRPKPDARDSTELAAAASLLGAGEPAEAARIATNVAERTKLSETRSAALTTLAWACLGLGELDRARRALERVAPHDALDLYCFAALQSASGNPDLAINALELARSARTLGCGGAKLLVDLYAARFGLVRAVASALENRDVLGVENCRVVVKASSDAGEFSAAAALASVLFGTTCAPEDAAAFVRASAYRREPGAIARALDEVIARFLGLGKLSHARSLLLELRVDWRLPSGIRSALDTSLRALDASPTLPAPAST